MRCFPRFRAPPGPRETQDLLKIWQIFYPPLTSNPTVPNLGRFTNHAIRSADYASARGYRISGLHIGTVDSLIPRNRRRLESRRTAKVGALCSEIAIIKGQWGNSTLLHTRPAASSTAPEHPLRSPHLIMHTHCPSRPSRFSCLL